jgi:hypothetical protein
MLLTLVTLYPPDTWATRLKQTIVTHCPNLLQQRIKHSLFNLGVECEFLLYLYKELLTVLRSSSGFLQLVKQHYDSLTVYYNEVQYIHHSFLVESPAIHCDTRMQHP